METQSSVLNDMNFNSATKATIRNGKDEIILIDIWKKPQMLNTEPTESLDLNLKRSKIAQNFP